MVDNFQQISDLLNFDSEDDFYHLQILKRKKENPELGSNSHVIKTYYVSSKAYLEQKREEIIALSSLHNARACINLNRRSFEKIAFHLLKKVTDQIMNKDYKSARKAYESVCGGNSNEPLKRWILDIDDKSIDEKNLRDIIDFLPPFGDKFVAKIETKNGYHLIVNPFDVSRLREANDFDNLGYNFDIQKDNPTILFIPF